MFADFIIISLRQIQVFNGICAWKDW